jgi:hypothetical protein
LIAQIRSLLTTVESNGERAGLLSKIARAESVLGNASGAKQMLTEAAQFARRIGEGENQPRPFMLAMVARSLHDTGDVSGARTLLSEAGTAAEKMRDAEARFHMLGWVALARAASKDAAGAKQTLQRIATLPRVWPGARRTMAGGQRSRGIGGLCRGESGDGPDKKGRGQQALIYASIALKQREAGDRAARGKRSHLPWKPVGRRVRASI